MTRNGVTRQEARILYQDLLTLRQTYGVTPERPSLWRRIQAYPTLRATWRQWHYVYPWDLVPGDVIATWRGDPEPFTITGFEGADGPPPPIGFPWRNAVGTLPNGQVSRRLLEFSTLTRRRTGRHEATR